MFIGLWVLSVIVVFLPIGYYIARKNQKIKKETPAHLFDDCSYGLTGWIVFFIIFGLVMILLENHYQNQEPPVNKNYGVTFSSNYVKELGLEPQVVLTQILEDLKIKNFRLPVYWNEIEKEEGVFDFSSVDAELKILGAHQAQVILAIGYRVPRWPECYAPEWTKDMSDQEFHQQVLKMLGEVVARYKNNPTIVMWQVENEPLLTLFGICRANTVSNLKEEIALVKSLDSRKVMTTDSGELSSWWELYNVPDVLGTSVYRVVKNPLLGYWHYWFIPSYFYQFKDDLNALFQNRKTMIVSELSCEPWSDQLLAVTPIAEQDKSVDIKQFKDNLAYAQKLNFPSVYLWGVEWWYWRKVHGDSTFWDSAKMFFNR